MAEEDVPHSLFDPEDKQYIEKYMRKRVNDNSAGVSDQAQFGEYMTTPSLVVGSKYHLFIPKEISLGNLDEEKMRIVYAWTKVINRAVYMADKGLVTQDLPNDINSVFVSWLNSTRGKNMQHEKYMVEQTINIKKSEDSNKDKQSIFGRFQKK